MTITILAPWACPHPEEALSSRAGGIDACDYTYELCARCGSERLADGDDHEPGNWGTALDPADVPASFWAAAGLAAAAQDQRHAYLRARAALHLARDAGVDRLVLAGAGLLPLPSGDGREAAASGMFAAGRQERALMATFDPQQHQEAAGHDA